MGQCSSCPRCCRGRGLSQTKGAMLYVESKVLENMKLEKTNLPQELLARYSAACGGGEKVAVKTEPQAAAPAAQDASDSQPLRKRARHD